MRPMLVLVVASLILGGVKLFIDSDATLKQHEHAHIEEVISAVDYDVELTLTFDAGPDEFSVDSAGETTSLLLQLNGKPLLRRTDRVPPTESPIILKDVTGIVIGRNEFFVQASPADSSTRPALRIRIMQAGTPVADDTLWPEFGGVVQGTVALEVSQ